MAIYSMNIGEDFEEKENIRTIVFYHHNEISDFHFQLL